MSKLFISYRRKSWAFTHRLADELRARLDAEVFVDVDGVDQPDFEKAILQNLRESNAVLLVITELTFADRIHRDDDWVRREIRESIALGLPLILVCVEGLLPPSGLPDDIKDIARMQGINFYPEYFSSAVERLTDFVIRVSSVKHKEINGNFSVTLQPEKVEATGTVVNPPEPQISGKTSLAEALDLLDKGDFSKATFLLEGLRDSGHKSNFVNIDDLLQEARKHQQQTERRRIAQIDYEEIAALVKRRITHDQGIVAFQKWQQEYSDWIIELDTDNIRDQITYINIPPIIQKPKSFSLMPHPFDWIDIPEGKVTLGGNKGAEGGYITRTTTFDVPAFSIAKYPVTNFQFAMFLDADGYNQKRWWAEDSWSLWENDGWELRQKEGWLKPRYWQDEKWNKPNYPVAGISWYEAMAFCRWLSEVANENITLPNEQQWQRAAQADTQWGYPYGDRFDKTRCNFRTLGTTAVTEYESKNKGDSPFGVTDMSGNVWEWCLTKYKADDNNPYGADVRVLRGGSWWSGSIDDLRVDCRSRSTPYDRTGGFRIARP